MYIYIYEKKKLFRYMWTDVSHSLPVQFNYMYTYIRLFVGL
jgi:hypothetical protein